MYVSDRKATSMLAMMTLVIGPWVGVSRESWGWLLDILLLLSVIGIGRNGGKEDFRLALTVLFLGYGLAVTFNNISSIGQLSFVPWAGLVTLWAEKENFPTRVTVFWSLIAAGLAGSIPALAMLHLGIPQQTVQALIQVTFEQYRQAGMIEAFQQQGMTEAEIKSLLEQIINYIILLTPGLATVSGLVKWGAVYYFFTRWFPQTSQTYRPFTHWRIPWYAIWGMNLAVASYLLGDQFQWLTLRSFGINLMLVYAAVVLVLGCSILLFYLRSPWLSGLIKIVLIITSLIYIQITVVALILLGLFDIVLDFRRLSLVKKDK